MLKNEFNKVSANTDIKQIDRYFANLAHNLEKNVEVTLGKSSKEEVYTIIPSEKNCLVGNYINNYASDNENARAVMFKSEGFKTFHEVCKKNDFRLEFKGAVVDGYATFAERIEVHFGKNDRYADSKDANFWEDKDRQPKLQLKIK